MDEVLQRLLDVLFGRCVQSADVDGHVSTYVGQNPNTLGPCGLIQKQNGRILQECTGDSDTLLLAAAQPDTTLADLGVVAVGEAQDAVVDLGSLRSGDNLLLGGAELAIPICSQVSV